MEKTTVRNVRMRTEEISICAFSAACSALILFQGFQLTFGEFFWYFCAAIPLRAPRTLLGKAMAFGVASLVSLLICGSNFVYMAPFFLMIGPFPLIEAVLKPLGKWPGLIAHSVLFFLGGAIVMWFTPMLLVQVGTLNNPSITMLALGLLSLASFPSVYGLSLLITKVFSHFSKGNSLQF